MCLPFFTGAFYKETKTHAACHASYFVMQINLGVSKVKRKALGVSVSIRITVFVIPVETSSKNRSKKGVTDT